MLIVFKIFLLLLILGVSVIIGSIISSKYSRRVKELQDLITSLEVFETRIRYTYDTIPNCFLFIAKHIKSNVSKIFENAGDRLKNDKNISAGTCLETVIDEEKMFLCLNNEDIEVLKGLCVSLGQTNIEGQNKNIRMILQSLDARLVDAVSEKNKNYKLSRNMGIVVGLMIAILLI